MGNFGETYNSKMPVVRPKGIMANSALWDWKRSFNLQCSRRQIQAKAFLNSLETRVKGNLPQTVQCSLCTPCRCIVNSLLEQNETCNKALQKRTT